MDGAGHDTDAAAPPAKRLGRRDTLKLLGVTLTGAVAAGVRTGARTPPAEQPASPPVQGPAPPGSRRGPAWRLRPIATGTVPRSFTATEFAALSAAVDRIIPDTDTPGARTAGVHWFLDDVCAQESGWRTQLRAGVARLDEQARAERGKPFAELAPAEQDALLERASADDRPFFGVLKAQVIDAYYKSEMGQVGELEWVGHEFNDEFPGACTHGDPMVHPRPTWPRSRA